MEGIVVGDLTVGSNLLYWDATAAVKLRRPFCTWAQALETENLA